MESKLILLCLLFLLLNSEARIYQPDEFINITKKWIYEQEDLENIKKNLSIFINDYYAFNQIAKNPPQPNFDSNYHNQIDIVKELSSIQTKDKDIYTFYRDIKKIFAKTKDCQFYLDIGLNEILNYIYLVAPIGFRVNTVNYDEIKIVVSRNQLESYTLDPAIEEIINNNSMKPVKSINGKNPFDFISEFGNNYLNCRSPHANFALKSENILSSYTLTNYPFSYEELSKLNVVYESGDNFTINYLLMTGLDLEALQIKRNFLLKKNNIKKESNYHFIDINKIQYNIERNAIESNKKILNSNKKLKDFSKYINWDFEFPNIVKCRVDNENKINVYCINNFRGEETPDDFLNMLAMCAALFYNNTYPIALISNLNEGDSAPLYHFFLEMLSPLITSKLYAALRKTEGIMKNTDLMSLNLSDAEKCEEHALKDFFNKVNKINYGNGITDELSEIFLWDGGKGTRKALEELKLLLTFLLFFRQVKKQKEAN